MSNISRTVICTNFGNVLISEETMAEMIKELGVLSFWDRRTRAGKVFQDLADDVSAIAEVEYMHGGQLTEI